MRKRILGVHPCGPDHQVVTVSRPADGPAHTFRREVCAECPWRKDSPIGAFPVEAYRHSARTATDMAGSTFACHMSGSEKPATCAGFLLSDSAYHNMIVRLARMRNRMLPEQVERTAPTYRTYREMAEANGVDPNDPALRECR
jgi:hypothetical protein